MQKLWQAIIDILRAPLVGEVDAIRLFLLTGLVLVFLAAWAIILAHIRAAAPEIV